MEWESDSLILLRAWESHVQGEGADKTAEPAKDTFTGHEGLDT